MAHDVFISYAAEDKAVADAICRGLEADDMRCWYAPRDVPYGTDFEEAIVGAITESRLMVLIISAHSVRSAHVKREVQLASMQDVEVPILPFRIEDVQLPSALRYYLASVHWLDASSSQQLEDYLRQLVKHVRARLVRRDPAEWPAAASGGTQDDKPSPSEAPADGQSSRSEAGALTQHGGDVEPAPSAAPSTEEETRGVADARPGPRDEQDRLSDTQSLRLQYWMDLMMYLRARSGLLRLRAIQPHYWTYVDTTAETSLRLIAMISVRRKRVTAGVHLTGTEAKSLFRTLRAASEEIEREVGERLEWNERAKRSGSLILLHREGVDFKQRNEWPAQHEWLCQRLETLHRACAPRIQNYDPTTTPALVATPGEAPLAGAAESREAVDDAPTDDALAGSAPSGTNTLSAQPSTVVGPQRDARAGWASWVGRLASSRRLVIAAIVCLIPIIMLVAIMEFKFMREVRNSNSARSTNRTVVGNGASANQSGNTAGGRRNFELSREEYERDIDQFSAEAARLGDSPGRGPDDGYILAKVRAGLGRIRDVDTADITVEVNNGVVTLRGIIADEASRARILRAVRDVAGEDYHDYLKTTPRESGAASDH